MCSSDLFPSHDRTGEAIGRSLSGINNLFKPKDQKDQDREPKKNYKDTVFGQIERIKDESFTLVGNLFSSSARAVGGLLTNRLPAAWTAVWEGLKTGKGWLKNKLNQPRDIYIPGKADPVLTAIGFREGGYRDWETDRKSTRLNSSHITRSRMPSSA